MPCHYCGRGLHRECLTRCKTCHPSPKNPKNIVSALKPSSTGLVGRPLKELDAMKDVKSTGRKRAALLYPLDKNHPCEWRGKKNCGGGLKPIVGCLDGFQRHRHHGPIKNPVHNEQGNVHRICATCVAPETRILTENLEWVPAGELTVGDRLIGFTEEHIPYKRTSHQQYGGRYTVFEPSIVESIRIVNEPSYRLIMENGTDIVCSHNHLWVGSSSTDAHLLWRKTEKMRIGDSIAFLVEPWEIDTSWESGWLAGYLDGEGYLSGYHLGMVQKVGDISDLSSDLLLNITKGKLHYTFRPKPAEHHSDTEVFRLSNLSDILTVLGSVRPYRLLQKVPEFLYNKYPLSGRTSKKIKISSIQFIGNTEVVSIQTTSKTYIAEGFYSHNCHNRWHALNDPIYNEQEYMKLPHSPEDATEDEIRAADVWWKLPEARKALQDVKHE